MAKQPEDEGEELITMEECAKRLFITPQALRRLKSKGKLEGIAQDFFGRSLIDWRMLRRQMKAGALRKGRVLG